MSEHASLPALTEAEVALRLGVSSAVLRAWRLKGVGPRFCRFGRSVRYLEADVERFIAASAVTPLDSTDEGNQRHRG